MTPLYDAIIRHVAPRIRTYHRLRVRGAENLPPPGQAAILACNHPGCLWWDGFCIAAALPDRYVRFIAHYWDDTHYFMRAFLARIEARYLDRSLVDIRPDSPVVRDLREGHLMAQFPEESYHTFRDRHTLFSFSPQIARYAHLGRAVLLPTAVIGVEEACPTFFGYKARGRPLHIPYHPPVLLPARVTIDIGEPVSYEDLTGRSPDDEADEGVYRRTAARLRERVRDRIRLHRPCRMRDIAYNLHHSPW